MAVLMGISPHTNWKMFINSIVRNAYENKESQIFASTVLGLTLMLMMQLLA